MAFARLTDGDRMSDGPAPHSAYDFDILAWSEAQAAGLRALARTRRDLPNDLELERVAEELEDMGRSELIAVQSFVRLMLVHIVKAVSVPGAAAVPHWRSEVVAFHNEVLGRLTPSMARRLDVATLWRRALKEAEAALALYGQNVSAGLARECLLDAETLLDSNFDFDACVDDLRRRIGSSDPVS